MFDEQESVHFDDYEATPELVDASTTTSPENPIFNEDPDILMEEDGLSEGHRWGEEENLVEFSDSLQDLCIDSLFKIDKPDLIPDKSNYLSRSGSLFQKSQKSLHGSYATLNSINETIRSISERTMKESPIKKKSLTFAGLKRQFKKMYLAKQNSKDNLDPSKWKNDIQKNSQDIFPKEKISHPISIEGRPSLTNSGNAGKFCLIKERTTKVSETPSYNMFAKYKEDENLTYLKPEIGSTAESFEELASKLFEGVNIASF